MNDDATTRILTAIEALAGRMDRLEAGQRATSEALAGRMDRLEIRLDQLEAGQNKLRADVMERIDRVQNAVTQLRDDYAVNFGASDAVKRANENTREELRSLSEVVFTLVRQLRAVSGRVDQLEEKR